MTEHTHALPEVLDFYRDLPFNYGDLASLTAMIEGHDLNRSFPALARHLSPETRVIEAGCGVGWLSLSIARQFGCPVTGLDFNPVAVGQARAAAAALRLNARIELADLFLYTPRRKADLVVSMGALHHTGDCLAAVETLCRNCLAPAGRVFIGLYHRHGRRPFLQHFQEMRAAGADEETLRREYVRLDRRFQDPVQQESWFRDQVLHPHETQHTLEELVPLLRDCGLAIESTSVNGFQDFAAVEDLFPLERDLETAARQHLEAGLYDPGFFIFMARHAA